MIRGDVFRAQIQKRQVLRPQNLFKVAKQICRHVFQSREQSRWLAGQRAVLRENSDAAENDGEQKEWPFLDEQT